MNPLPKEKPSRTQRTIVFVTFESEFAPCGGLAAVMKVLPKEMAKHEPSFTLAPYFKNITGKKKSAKLITSTNLKFDLQLQGRSHAIEMWQHTDATGFKTYLLASDDFFTAPEDPYVNPSAPEKLLQDALFFCAAVPKALVALGKTKDLVLHLQDWESASVAWTIQREDIIQSAACILTLHNPYDSKSLIFCNDKDSRLLLSALDLQNSTVLTQMIPLVHGPLSTVSQNFADELTSEPLHAHVFADHLQKLFVNKGLVGIDNGPFGTPQFPFSSEARVRAEQGQFELIQHEKLERRRKLSEVIEAYQREIAGDSTKPTWGEDLDLSDPALPVFRVMGRDDPRQKGFDVAAAAIRMIPPGKARYIFTAMPGDEGLAGLQFLEQLARERPGEVKAFPFRLDDDPFKALQEGSSFMLMCSLYEPFGDAIGAYAAGMPVVARATGGLVQQVVPYPSPCLSRYGRQLVASFLSWGSNPTGFLFREPSVLNEAEAWREIMDCAYWVQVPRGDRVEARKDIPLFGAMARGAAWAIRDAIDLYTSHPNEYSRMIYDGFRMLDNFSWDRVVREYQRLYDGACK